MSVKSWTKENEPLVAFLASVLFIGTVLWALLKFVFAPPDLAITVQTVDLLLPSYTYEQLAKALDRDSARLSAPSGLAMRQVRGFLRDTKNFTQVTLTNSSSKSLTNADLRFHYVRDADGYAIEGDALDLEERSKLVEAIRLDPSNGLLTLRGIPRIPPKSTIKLYIWGDISYAALFGSEQVTVTYDGGAGELITERTIRGLDAFIYNNSGLLVIAILLFNVGAWNLFLQHKGVLGKATSSPVGSSPDPG
jgi:hypothetical protein